MASHQLRKMLITSLFRNEKSAAGASPSKIRIHLCGMCTLVPAALGVSLHRLDIKTRKSRCISSLASPTPGLAIKCRRSS